MGKRIHRLCRRFTAVLVVACMLAGTLGSGGAWGGLMAYADTELPSDDLGTKRSDGLAYKWIASKDYGDWGGVSYRYDLHGLNAGQDNYDDPGTVQLSYSEPDSGMKGYGFPTFLAMAGKGRTSPPEGKEVPNGTYDPTVKVTYDLKSKVKQDANYYMAKLGQRDANGNLIDFKSTSSSSIYNGAVEKISFGDGSGDDPRVEVESRITTTPSPDGKYIFVDYYLCNVNGNLPPEGRTFWLASPFDLEVGGTLKKYVKKTDRGFYTLNVENKATVDVITNDPGMGIDGVNTRWIGRYQNRNPEMFTDNPDVPETSPGGSDVSVAYSWEFKLRPNETVHRRIAFATRQAAYYVSWAHGTDSDPGTTKYGTYRDPFKTLDYAISQCKDKNAAIFIQDYKAVDGPIELAPSGFSAQTSIGIESSDVDRQGNSLVGKEGYIKTLARTPSYTGPLFTQSGSDTVRFGNITLDGNGTGTEPLIKSTDGTMQLNSGTTLKNSPAGAVSVTGGGNLYMNGAEEGTIITGNTSDKGAVDFEGALFTVMNNVQIHDNTKAGQPGTAANVYLPTGKYIQVDGDLGASSIGVTTESMPVPSPDGKVTGADQEIKVAGPSDKYPNFTGSSPFSDAFFADLNAKGMQISPGAGVLGADNERNTVMQRSSYAFVTAYVDQDTGGAVPGHSTQTSYIAQGDPVDIAAPGAVTGYKLTAAAIEQGQGNTLSWVQEPGKDFGRITGTMPGQTVNVDYQYQKESSQLVFHANGGTPAPPTLSGTQGSPVTTMIPTISRYGYIFKGWCEDMAHPDKLITALPPYYPPSQKDYYAVFVKDPKVHFNLTVEYVDSEGRLLFQTGTQENVYNAESDIQAAVKNVPNFKWDRAASYVTPAQYDYSGDTVEDNVQVGKFDPNGTFTGKMPAMDTVIHYVYQKDSSQPPQPVLTDGYLNNGIENWGDFDKEHIDGRLISDSRFDQPEETGFPGQEITVHPKTVYGYNVVYGFISQGDKSFERGILPSEKPGDWPLSDRFLVYAGSGSFDSGWNFTGSMPNQQFKISYVYEPTGESYDFTTRYLDNKTADELLKNIVDPPLKETHPAEYPVKGEYQAQYGYTLPSGGNSFEPSGAPVSFDGTTLTGKMPNDSLTLTYALDRDQSKWAAITYKAGPGGTLKGGEGVSPDVHSSGNGIYTASVLRNDSSEEGGRKGYTLAQIRTKRLMPEAEPAQSQYYRFDGWCMEGSDTVLPDDYQFTGDTVLTAHFGEKPGAWVTVGFEAGAHGALDKGQPTSLHTTFDKNWNDIWGGLPTYTKQPNYLVKGWFDGQGNKLDEDNTSPLKDGQTYTVRFYPDPAVFGTDVSAPDSLSGLNSAGKGRITVYGTIQGYQYVLTDSSGKVLSVNQGSGVSSRTEFDNLYPGKEYFVYEVTGESPVHEGDMIGSVAGHSAPARAVTPVVDYTNYRVIPDEEQEGKTQLIIDPADRASDYGVLDSSGNVVVTPQTGADGWQKPSGNPAQLSFTGLDYNKEYTVVDRPSGQTEITPASREPYGSVITTYPGVELDLTDYTVTAQNGKVMSVNGQTVEEESYGEAHENDLVKLKAEPAQGNGKFSHWEFNIGSVKGLGTVIHTPEISFTMPKANLVLTAVYTYPGAGTPSNARVVSEVLGGSKEELDLDSNAVPDLEGELTTELDSQLIDVNKADVSYKVVYRKNAVKASESNAIKAKGDYNTDHDQAYKGAWGLDVSIERYVDGRRVKRATDSNAAFKTFVQLDKKDVDMMDYQLYEFSKNPDGGYNGPVTVDLESDPEATGGLFSFEAREDSRYVMVYNRAYRVYFLNNTVPPDDRYRQWFKVRRNEAPSDSYYSARFNEIMEDVQLQHFTDANGADYDYYGWSYSEKKPVDFNEYKKITKKTYVYAYYDNNAADVNDARQRLEAAVRDAITLSDDHFLKQWESAQLKGFIEAAQEKLDWKLPDHAPASLTDLEEAIRALDENTAPIKQTLKERYDQYEDIQEGSHKGGGSGGGGGGAGTRAVPFDNTAPRSYRIGTNGSWIETTGPAGEKQMSFMLNGGSLLSGMWARLEYPDTTQAAGNGWYHFNTKGVMETGWICDENGSWYYLSTGEDGYAGRMAAGWRMDGSDGHRYYLEPSSGAMALGWRQIDGKWYYFSPVGEGTYNYDPSREKWTFGGGNGRPMGSMYKNEVTPDGYSVGADGAWIQ